MTRSPPFFFLFPPPVLPLTLYDERGLNALAFGQCKRNLIQPGDKGRLKSQMSRSILLHTYQMDVTI